MFNSRLFAGMIACFGLMHVDAVPLIMKARKINTVSKLNIDNSNIDNSNISKLNTNVNYSDVNDSDVNVSIVNDSDVNVSIVNDSDVNNSDVNNTDSNMTKNMSNFTFFFDEITLHDEIRMINKCDKYTNTSCKFCQGMVNLIDNEFEKYNKTIYDITSMIKDICQLIHAPIVTQECVGIMNSIEKILNMSKAGNNSSEICHYLHYC